jgi:hypothetical protein
MINHLTARIVSLSAHHIGSYSEGEDITFSKTSIENIEEDLAIELKTYFLTHFKEPLFYRFTFTSEEIELNPLYNFVSNIFDDPSCLHEQSVKIARHLYDKSKHPNIKSGELSVAYIEQILVDDELLDAIAIFKSEGKDSLLTLSWNNADLMIDTIQGIPTSRVDKACLILNIDREMGYKICNIDHSNKNRDAHYWKEDFLVLQPISNDYTQTIEYIQLTKSFIKDRMTKEFDVDRKDEAVVMSRSHEYFKHVESFDADEYEQQVFKDGRVMDSFKDYKDEYQTLKGIDLFDHFNVSDQAVRKQSRVFKSIIKLDKNFHIYVHGDREKIQKGVDENGNKYYILYYNDET